MVRASRRRRMCSMFGGGGNPAPTAGWPRGRARATLEPFRACWWKRERHWHCARRRARATWIKHRRTLKGDTRACKINQPHEKCVGTIIDVANRKQRKSKTEREREREKQTRTGRMTPGGPEKDGGKPRLPRSPVRPLSVAPYLPPSHLSCPQDPSCPQASSTAARVQCHMAFLPLPRSFSHARARA